MSDYDYDLFVIGAGSGGARAVRIAADHGAKVALAERQFYGGTCVNLGCVPKKLMTYVAGYASDMHHAAGYGWSVGDRSLDWKRFIERKDGEVKFINDGYEGSLKDAGIEIYWGDASIVDPHTVRINDETVTADRILIATGGKPAIPPIEGAKEHGIVSDDVFYLEEQPKRLVIAGVGYIGLEFAGIFKQLGTDVHVIFRREEILNESFDGEVRSFLHKEMIKKGIHFHPKTNITKVEKQGDGVIVHLDSGETLEADHVLFATGRTPNIEGLGLEEVGVELGAKGEILVNKDDQTNIPSIYAIGDVTDRVALTPVAIREGHALADRLFGNKQRYLSYDNIPSAVFSDPNIGQVGLTEEQAREKYPGEIDIYKTDFLSMKLALADSEQRTFMKLVVHSKTDKVLGVHMVGEEAGEIMQGFATAIIAGATKADFDNTVAIHPVAAEEFVTLRDKSA